MKTDGNSSLLNLILGVSLVVLAVLCIQFFFKSRELRSFQSTVAAYQSNQNRKAQLNLLIADLLEYSKTHPAIDPLLESVGAKRNPAAPANPSKPSSK